MNPLAIATDGFLNSPLSISTSGYLNFLIESIIKSSSGGGGYKNKHYNRLLREDNELLEIILALIIGEVIL